MKPPLAAAYADAFTPPLIAFRSLLLPLDIVSLAYVYFTPDDAITPCRLRRLLRLPMMFDFAPFCQIYAFSLMLSCRQRQALLIRRTPL